MCKVKNELTPGNYGQLTDTKQKNLQHLKFSVEKSSHGNQLIAQAALSEVTDLVVLSFFYNYFESRVES